MKNKLLLSGVLTFLLSIVVVIYWALLKTNFNFTYPLDDSYIHLAIAKNLAQYGVWGVTKFEFTSASSSPLYTIIIATLIKLFGNNLYIPLLLNIGIGFAIVAIASKFIKEHFSNIPKIYYYLVLNLFILFLPLHTIVFLAMEHTLHCLFVLLLFIEFYKYLNGKLTNQYLLPLYSFLSLSTRYETLFILFPIAMVLLYKKDYKLLILTSIAGAVSIFGFGAYFISQGGRLLPYSVLVKGDSPQMNLQSIIEYLKIVWMKFIINKGASTVLLSSIALMAFSFYKKLHKTNFEIFAIITITTVITLIHTFIGGPGHFFRYESYIITLFFFSVLVIYNRIGKTILIKCLILFTLLGVSARIYQSFIKTPQASQNIYEQQIQMSNYVAKHKEIESIVLNDIGAIAYFNSDVKILDVWALATPELSEFVLWEKKAGLPVKITTQMKKELIGKLSKEKGIDFVMIYPNLFQTLVQDNWKLTDSLVMKSKRVVCADTLVYFFKVNK